MVGLLALKQDEQNMNFKHWISMVAMLALATGCDAMDDREATAPPTPEPIVELAEKAASVTGRFVGYETVVSDTHQASTEARQNARAEVVAKDKCWPGRNPATAPVRGNKSRNRSGRKTAAMA